MDFKPTEILLILLGIVSLVGMLCFRRDLSLGKVGLYTLLTTFLYVPTFFLTIVVFRPIVNILSGILPTFYENNRASIGLLVSQPIMLAVVVYVFSRLIKKRLHPLHIFFTSLCVSVLADCFLCWAFSAIEPDTNFLPI